MWAWGPVTNPTARALASWLCTLWGRHEGARGGGMPLAWVWRVRVRALSHAKPPALGASGRGPSSTGLGCGGCGCGDRSQTPQGALLRAGFARCGGGTRVPPGGASLAWGSGVCSLALSNAQTPVLGTCGRCLLPTGCGCGWCRRGDPSPIQRLALLRAGLARCQGAHGGEAAAWVWDFPRPTAGPWGVRSGPTIHWLMGAVCGRGDSACPGSFSCAEVRRVLCALPRLAAPGGRCCLVPVLVPWWWPAACFSSVPRGPALVRRASSGLRSWCSGRLSHRRGAFFHPRGCSPRHYWAAAWGRWRPAGNQAHRACRWPLSRQGRWACSASYPLGVPRWGYPWRVPPASVFGCVRCGELALCGPGH